MIALALVAGLAVCACTQGTPPGFSGGLGGDRWTFPLVGPLEDGLLLTTVLLNTHGPYVFLIDTDAPISVVDNEVVKLAKLRTIAGPRRLDEGDTQRVRVYAEVIGMELGTLVVERQTVMVMPANTYDTAGRRVHGVIGRDVLADSLAFGFDRDHGLGYLVTQKTFKPPPGATAIPYESLESRARNAVVTPMARRLVKATIGGAPFSLHLDLGAIASQLRESVWERANLVGRDIQAIVIDEVGSARRVSKVSEPAPATLGTLTGNVVVLPYSDKRWEERDFAGTLGLGFFAPYTVWANWQTKMFFLSNRKAVEPMTRITRWESAVLSKCENRGCIQARLVDPHAGKPLEEGKPHPGLILSITRDERAGGMHLEVLIEPQAQDPTTKLPYLIVNLPAHTDRLIHQLKPDFLGVKLVVVDASPYPRKCPSPDGCVDQLAR